MSHSFSTSATAATKRVSRIPWQPFLLAIAYIAAVLLVPVVIVSANLWQKTFATGAHEPLQVTAYSSTLPAPPSPDPSKKIAVVLSGPRGSEINDTMDPFEILTRSGVYNAYSVAPERTVLPLLPGPTLSGSSLDFVPHFSFAEYDTHIGRAPDVIAIPWFDGDYSQEGDAVVLEWIRAHFGPNTTILGICSGNMILADTGLLAGRTATSNTGTFQYVESHSPTTKWLHNMRYVDDGNIITSSNLTSGIAASLHVVDRFAGRAKALEVAREIGYADTETLDNPAFQPPAESLRMRLYLAGLGGRTQQLGVVLYDGVTELGLSGLIDPYLGTFSSRTYVMALERRIVQSRGGFQLLPRYTFNQVPPLDRVLVPASDDDIARHAAIVAWSGFQPGRPAEDLYSDVGHGESAYDVSLRDLALTYNGAYARVVADTLFYPVDAALFRGAAWPIGEVLAQVALMLLGAGIVFSATHLKHSSRSHVRIKPQLA